MARRERLFSTALPLLVVVLALHVGDEVLAQTGPGSDPVLVGAGDIVPNCLSGGSVANAAATAGLLDGIPGTVFNLGDNSYEDGTLAEYNGCYDQTWGRHKDRTFPVTGNHEYQTPGAAGYFDYFNGPGNDTGPAGDRTKGYYSYNLGSWHIVVLNSECGSSALWDTSGCALGSPQERWLRADLSASPTNNIIAMFHKPRYSSGWRETATQPLWKALYDYGVDVVLSGHVHNYERLAPAGPAGTPDDAYGIRQFVVGTGGKTLVGTSSSRLAISEVANSNTYGVLKLTLHESSYDWEFVPAVGSFSDRGTALVHGPPPDGVVAAWEMEENGGPSLLDSSGGENDAAVKGSPTWVLGHTGLGLRLNGSTDYAVAADSPSLNPNQLTLALWVAPATKSSTQYLLRKASAYELSLSSKGRPSFRLNGSTTYRIDATSTAPAGAWTHVAGTYDGRMMHLYVNGVEQGNGVAGPPAIASSTAAVGIGAQSGGTGPLQGTLDEVRIYRGALTPDQIRALATTVPAAPAAPSGLAATAVSSTRVDLTWTDGSTNEDSFSIERMAPGGSFTVLATTRANVTTFSDTTVSPATTYTYRVRAQNTADFSPYSDTASVTTPAGPVVVAPAAPSGLAATASSSTRVDLSWTDNSTNEGSFAIERGTGAGTGVAFAVVGSVSADVTTYSDTAVTAGTQYSYRVRASNSAGSSDYSNIATATTPALSSSSPIKDITFEGGALVNATNGADKVVGGVTLENVSPLKGAYSARIPNLASTYLEESFTATDDLYVSLYIRLNALPASDARIILVSDAGTTVGNIVLRTTGRLRLRVDVNAVGVESPPLQVGQLYRVGIHQRRGSGSNGVLEAFLSAGDAAFTTPFASLVTGTWITSADRVRAGATNTGSVDLVVDDIRLDGAAMPGPSGQ